MTCAQGLLRLLWGGGPEVRVLRDCMIDVTSRRMECTLLTPDFSQVPAVALQQKVRCRYTTLKSLSGTALVDG